VGRLVVVVVGAVVGGTETIVSGSVVVGVVTVGAVVAGPGVAGLIGRETAAGTTRSSEPLVAVKATPPLTRARTVTPATDVTRAWRVARSAMVRNGCMVPAW
jgi:hypothetical protein